MPTPIPPLTSATPYDIAGIPYAPLVPGWQDWLAVFLTGAVLAGLFFLQNYLRQRARKRGSWNALRLFREKLNYWRKRADLTTKDLAELSLFVKRFLTSRAPVNSSIDYSVLAPSELATLAASEKNPSLAAILKALVQIDEQSYAPSLQLKEIELQQFLTMLQNYCDYWTSAAPPPKAASPNPKQETL